MTRLISLLVITALLTACAPARVTQDEVVQLAATLDYGNYTSSTLATKSWEALEQKDYAATLAYTQKCVELYGERGKAMNAELSNYPPVERVNNYWALNDAGTCLHIMANVYETLRMYPEAAEAYRSLGEDFTWAQCYDPKGWYWPPAAGATAKAKELSYK